MCSCSPARWPRLPDGCFKFALLHTTDVFNEDAISFMLADLNREGSTHTFREHLLSSTATEKFVTERLLPLLPDAKPPLLINLKSVLKQAGTRHGRRYVFECE